MSATVRPALVLGLILAAGCGGAPNTSAPKTGDKQAMSAAAPDSAPGAGLPSPTAVVPPAPAAPQLADPGAVAAAEAAARLLLDAVQKGTATTAALTDDLKKRVAPPITSAEKDRGYSDWAADSWLKGFANKVWPATVVGVPVGPTAVGVEAGPPAQSSATTGPLTRTLARLVKVGGEWKLDWLHVGPPAGPGLAALPASAGAGRFVVAAFLAAVLDGDATAAEPLMTTRAKAALAPPLAGDPGFSRGTLWLKLRGLPDGATAATVATFDGTRAAGEFAGKRPFGLTVTPGPDGWLIDGVEGP
jgi:hypothetical protein